MKSLVIYDSVYGNTEKIAKAIGEALGKLGEVAIKRVGEVKMEDLPGVELLILGSPTQKFRATATIKEFLKRISANSLKGVKVAAFDTRLTQQNIDGTPVLPYFVKIFGYASEPMANGLKKKGGVLVLPPEGFYVEGMEGPLQAGELERLWIGQEVIRIAEGKGISHGFVVKPGKPALFG
jgi:flavodoxin